MDKHYASPVQQGVLVRHRQHLNALKMDIRLHSSQERANTLHQDFSFLIFTCLRKLVRSARIKAELDQKLAIYVTPDLVALILI